MCTKLFITNTIRFTLERIVQIRGHGQLKSILNCSHESKLDLGEILHTAFLVKYCLSL